VRAEPGAGFGVVVVPVLVPVDAVAGALVEEVVVGAREVV
jgi:hypothetical protein